jgi:uncharacterized protein
MWERRTCGVRGEEPIVVDVVLGQASEQGRQGSSSALDVRGDPVIAHGAEAQRPQRAPASVLDGAGLEVLAEPECWDLLATRSVGRVAVSAGALPRILPVGFACHHGRIVFCAASGSTLERATRAAVLSFEVDAIAPDLSEGWSVVALGVARAATPDEIAFMATQPVLVRWSASSSTSPVSLSVEEITGRRFV